MGAGAMTRRPRAVCLGCGKDRKLKDGYCRPCDKQDRKNFLQILENRAKLGENSGEIPQNPQAQGETDGEDS